jgi:hypothetical protein
MAIETGDFQNEAHHHPMPHHHHEIHFFLDGEPHETHRQELTPNEIIKEFGHRDTATHYLVRIEGHRHISYQGKGDEPIKLHDGERFQMVSTGPTPVS